MRSNQKIARLKDAQRTLARLAGALVLLSPLACGESDAAPGESPREVVLKFRPTVQGEDFDCSEQFSGIGLGGAKIRVLDFRLWLHDVRLVRKNGAEVPLVLDESRPTGAVSDHGAWQKDGVVLLDFEDAKGSCEGTAETRSEIVGSAPDFDDYEGIRFSVGVPEKYNHLDATVAEYPFGAPGMAWQWKSGYRFVRIDASTEKFPKYYFHLGSTACEGEVGSFECSVKNIAKVELDGIDVDAAEIEADLASIYDAIDMDAVGAETISCMSEGKDNPLCPSMFGAFGLTYGATKVPEQRFFKVR